MITTPQQLIALLPLLIIGLTVIVLLLSIAWKRNHFIHAVLTVIGINLALLSLWFVMLNGPVDIIPLVRIDGFFVFYSGLTLVASLAGTILAYAWLDRYPGNRDEFYLLLLVSAMGGTLLASANHLAILFLGIELISFPLFGMLGYSFYKTSSLEASIKYMLLSVAAASFLLFGIALVYAKTGQLSFTALSRMLNDTMLMQPMLLAGLGMMMVGLGFKLSLVPFHLWTPDVYQGAPASVLVLLTTVSKIAIFAVTMRLFLCVPLIHSDSIRLVLAIVAFTSMLFGNLMALSQNNIKRVLGYSSITQLGYILIGLISVETYSLAIETVGVYLAGYLLASLGTLGIISLMSYPYTGNNADSLNYYRGLFWYKPMLSVALTATVFSLAGIPMTLGFIGKFYIIMIGLHNKLGWLISAVVVSSAIGLLYYLRIIISLYLPPLENHHCNTSSNWALTACRVMVIISSLLILFFGLYPQPLITLVRLAQPIL